VRQIVGRKTIVAINCGQAVTQVSLFESTGISLSLIGQATTPTTAGAAGGLAVGVRAALAVLERRLGVRLMDDSGLPLEDTGPNAACSWILTADSGGPIRVAVAGVIDDISGQSAMKATYGAGAAVSDLLAINDGRAYYHKIRDLRQNPVDMIVLAGGVDEGLFAGGGGRQVVNMASTIAQARPRPRYDPGAAIPLVFAGSAEARTEVSESLAGAAEVVYADNVRPDLSFENLAGVERAVLDVFHSKVVPNSPAFRSLAPYAKQVPPQPTGAAEGTTLTVLAGAWKEDLLAVDLGEVSTSVFTVIDGVLNRTGSDEVGLNMIDAGSVAGLVDAAECWIPVEMGREEIANTYSVQRVRPGAIPVTWRELLVQQAAARERLRLALDGHRRLVALLMGIRRQRNIDEVLGSYVAVGGQTLVDLRRINKMVITGRLVASATSPGQVASMVIDGFQPQGITQLLYDKSNLLPHLGPIAELDSSLAAQMLADDWLTPLGLVVAPAARQHGQFFSPRYGQRMAKVRIERQDGGEIRETVDYGTIKRIPLEKGEVVRVTLWGDRLRNLEDGQEFGGGGFLRTVSGGGALGVILDGRGRPIMMPQNPARRRSRVAAWLGALETYPEDLLKAAVRGEGS